jgi:hypothetical protein
MSVQQLCMLCIVPSPHYHGAPVPHWLQVKILRDSERSDPSGNPGGKSRGFGFVEFADHSHALAGEGLLLGGGGASRAAVGSVGLSQPHKTRQHINKVMLDL